MLPGNVIPLSYPDKTLLVVIAVDDDTMSYATIDIDGFMFTNYSMATLHHYAHHDAQGDR